MLNRPRLFALLLAFSAFSLASAGEGEPVPALAPKTPNSPDAILFTAAVGIAAPSLGIKLRLFRLFEIGTRLGALPTLWSAEIDANILFPNPEPEKRATWYGGLEYLYYHEDGSSGKFRTGYLDGICGREQRFTPRFRWALEAGLAFQLFQEFHGGGAPITFPILPLARAELRYALL
jgi:hypothetical protein